MINRVLIRIKTVQLLYSYLLVKKPFSLEAQPSQPTKEKRFAYSLYLDTIYLFYQLARRVKGKNKTLPLLKTRFILKIEEDDRFKSLNIKYSSGNYIFASLEEELAENIKGSLLFKELESDSKEKNDRIWEEIFKAIIFPNPQYNRLVTTMQNYSLSGVERMKGMMDETFRNFYSTRDNIHDALKTLERSMNEARELYMRLLALPVELTSIMNDRLLQNRKKFLATEADLNPNMRLVNNPLPSMIENNPVFSEYREKHNLSWIAEDRDLLESLLKNIQDSELYQNYMSSPEHTEEADIEFWREAFRLIILESPDFLEYMENKSVFWNDDLEITATFVLKTLRQFENPETRENAVLPMYKDEEDSKFGFELFRLVVDNKDLYKNYIDKALVTDRWESDRLAFMDVVITMAALAEILNYPKIPLQVSINEYIELAKSYSTSKSGSFVHGLLATIIAQLREEGELHK